MKATPAFNLGLCERFGVRPLEWDRRHDSLFHEYDRAGRRHMQYVHDRGAYADVPYDATMADFRTVPPRMLALRPRGDQGGLGREAAATS